MLKFLAPINRYVGLKLDFLAFCKLEGDYFPLMTCPSVGDLISLPSTALPPAEGINQSITTDLFTNPTILKELVFKKALSLANKSGFVTGIPDAETFSAFMNICHTAVLDFVKTKAVFIDDIPMYNPVSIRGVYKTINLLLTDKTLSKVVFRDFTLIIGCNSIFKAHFLGNTIASLEPLLVTMIHKDALEYYTLCMLLEEEPDPSIFKVFVSPVLDSTTTPLPSVKAWYRKSVKPALLEDGFEVETHEKLFDHVFKTLKKPEEVKTISGLKDWLANTAIDFRETFTLGEKIGVELTA